MWWSGRNAAIDGNAFTRDEGGGVGCQEGNGFGNVAALAGPGDPVLA